MYFIIKHYIANSVIFSPRCQAGTSFLKRMQNLIERGDCLHIIPYCFRRVTFCSRSKTNEKPPAWNSL